MKPVKRGKILKEEYLDPQSLSTNALGRVLGVSPREIPATKVRCEATDSSGSATTVFALPATPVMSLEVFVRREQIQLLRSLVLMDTL